MTLTWLLLAAGAALTRGPERQSAPVRAPITVRSLQRLSAGAVLACCVVAFGVGRGVLAAAAAVPLTVTVVGRLHARPQRVRPSPSLALALDLVAIALHAGQPLSAALVLAAPAAGEVIGGRLAHVGGLLRLGADPLEAWLGVADDPILAPVAVAARRSAASGIRLAGAFEQLAAELRAQLRAAAAARAHRAGVFAAAPLGLCFLPSFVCLGIVPIVIGVAGAVLTRLS